MLPLENHEKIIIIMLPFVECFLLPGAVLCLNVLIHLTFATDWEARRYYWCPHLEFGQGSVRERSEVWSWACRERRQLDADPAPAPQPRELQLLLPTCSVWACSHTSVSQKKEGGSSGFEIWALMYISGPLENSLL